MVPVRVGLLIVFLRVESTHFVPDPSISDVCVVKHLSCQVANHSVFVANSQMGSPDYPNSANPYLDRSGRSDVSTPTGEQLGRQSM
jgi:hypothetical protein